ncbi:alpha/beta hydrolase [Microbispora sp. ZYX-F-249]|uniref:Alpha/beta hydrolase n=1 Tax=Microbispora maris TaxID=3144104 RepID=A0ABV0AYY5_9ACTN
MTVKTDTLKVPGATLHYEVSGSGPVLLLIPGAPADASIFAPIAAALADRYTVVTYDTRGTSRSPLDGPAEEQRIETHGDDAKAVLDAVGGEPAYVLGCSGGALIGLDLAARHPESVRTLVAHEPPALQLLPERERWEAAFQDVYETYRVAGGGAAAGKFIATVEGGLDAAESGKAPEPPQMPDMSQMTPEMLESMGRMQANFEFFFAHLLQPVIRHTPDVDALRAAPSSVVVAVGRDSKGQMPHESGVALADRLGTTPVEVPGDHQGFAMHPGEFAEAVHSALAG